MLPLVHNLGNIFFPFHLLYLHLPTHSSGSSALPFLFTCKYTTQTSFRKAFSVTICPYFYEYYAIDSWLIVTLFRFEKCKEIIIKDFRNLKQKIGVNTFAIEYAVDIWWVAVKFFGEPGFGTLRLIENLLYFVSYVNGVHNCLCCEPPPLMYKHKKSVKPFLCVLTSIEGVRKIAL